MAMQLVIWQMNYKFMISKTIESNCHIAEYIKSFCEEYNTVRDNPNNYTANMFTDYDDFVIIKLMHPDAVFCVKEVIEVEPDKMEV
jgi:hypothetical protein